MLQAIYYGDELDRIDDGAAALQRWLSSVGHTPDWPTLRQHTVDFFSRHLSGVFGGQITAGDGLVIGAFMDWIRPLHMIEIGVASGYSSAAILHFAECFGLLDNGLFLHSYDLMSTHAGGNVTGSLLKKHFPQYESRWRLNVEKTSIDLLADFPETGRPVLAFIDGGHNHPWPIMDIIALRKHMPPGSWVIMQDVQMMERWVADCVRFGVPSPAPVRGVNLAVSLWPGSKFLGQGLCYNTAAICLDATAAAFSGFISAALNYPFEIEFDRLDLLRA